MLKNKELLYHNSIESLRLFNIRSSISNKQIYIKRIPISFVAARRALIRKHFKLVEKEKRRNTIKKYDIFLLFIFYHAHTKRVAARYQQPI